MDSTETKYVTRKLPIPSYGWTVTIYEPSLVELQKLQKAHADGDVPAINELWKNLIEGWDCKTRKGEPLPVTLEGIEQLPASVIKAMAMALFKAVTQGDDDPKNTSAA